MEELLIRLASSELPTIFVIGGLLFLFLGVAGKFGASVDISSQKQVISGSIGVILLVVGVTLYFKRPPTSSTVPDPQNTTQTPAAVETPTTTPGPSPLPEKQKKKPVRESATTPQKPPTPPTIPHEKASDTLTIQVRDLEKKISELDFQIEKLEMEYSASPIPEGLLYELEFHQRETGLKLAGIERSLSENWAEIDKLRLRLHIDPGAANKIEGLEHVAIPDLESAKKFELEQLKMFAREIPKAKKREQLKRDIISLRGQRMVLKENLERLTSR